jgi:Lrp/AsnC family leucine-responsive transcriptional regulator
MRCGGDATGRRKVDMKELDDIDRQLLALLQKDDRLSLADLGKNVGLAASSVNERVKRLVTRGVIEGFHAHVSPEALGLDLLAFVFVGWSDPAVEEQFLEQVKTSAAVLECHHVTGTWNYLLKVRLPNTRELERFLASVVKTVQGVQRTETLIALSSFKETTSLTSDPLGSGRAA